MARRAVARAAGGRAGAVTIVVLAIILLWYAAAIGMNARLQRDAFENAEITTYSSEAFVLGTWSQDRPRLPAPHQVARELLRSVLGEPVTSRRSLVYHAAVTIEATILGFALGSVIGFALSLLVVHVRSLDRGMLPWIVASQTIPIVALAPMIVVILNQFGITGQLLLKLRLPASRPILFASLKVAVAASLVGTIVAEVTKSEDGGLGARLLAGSYYGQTIQIWAALFTAAACGACLVALVGAIERLAPGIPRRGRR